MNDYRFQPPRTSREKLLHVLAGVVLAGAGYALARVLYGPLTRLDQWRSDVPWHNQILINALNTGQNLDYSSYYWVLQWMAAGQLTPENLRNVAIAVLSAAMAAKLVLLYVGAAMVLRDIPQSMALAVAVFLMIPLDLDGTPQLYLGKFSGAIWHNSTTVYLVPFSIALFFLSYLYLTRAHAPPWLHVAVAVSIFLCGSAKPNYVLVLLPGAAAFLLATWLRSPTEQRKEYALRVGPRYALMLFASVATLLPAYIGMSNDGGVDGTSFKIQPFAVWRVLSDSPPLAALESFLLPLLGLFFVGFRRIGRIVILAAWVTASAVGQFILLAEVRADGSVLGHANWIWGAHVATLILYMTVGPQVLLHWTTLARWKKYILGGLALVQIALGLVYLTHLHSSPLTYT